MLDGAGVASCVTHRMVKRAAGSSYPPVWSRAARLGVRTCALSSLPRPGRKTMTVRMQVVIFLGRKSTLPESIHRRLNCNARATQSARLAFGCRAQASKINR